MNKSYTMDDVKVIRQSDYAVLVLWEDEAIWVPTSQIELDSEIDSDSDPGDMGDLVITAWLARKRGWLADVGTHPPISKPVLGRRRLKLVPKASKS